MPVLACLNGEIMPVEQAKVSVWDRGFVFGDSVYEVFRLYEGRCWLEESHLSRLKRSLKELDFAPHDLIGMMERIYRTIAASGIKEGTLYVQITSRRRALLTPVSRPAGAPHRGDHRAALR